MWSGNLRQALKTVKCLSVQVHAEECERLASEAAVARARACAAARYESEAAAARAAEKHAQAALAESEHTAAELYDQWRARYGRCSADLGRLCQAQPMLHQDNCRHSVM